MRSVAVGLAALLCAACQGPKVIPDSDLVNIFHDAYIANAYIGEKNIAYDSLYIYEPIFERYGYTMDDLQHTIRTFTQRKSAMLSDLMSEVSRRLDDEAKAENRKMVVLDTIENLAVRSYTRVMYSDSLIRVKRLKDTTKLHIRLSDIVPGEYTVSFTYLIDTLDENRNSRVEAYLLTHDTMESLRHSMMLSRYREGKYSRKFKADTVHNELVVNMFYHPKHEEAKKPDITINDFKIVRVLPDEVAVDSLYHEQLNIRLINHELMSAFTADSLAVEEIVPDSLAAECDSLMLTERDSLAIERDSLAGENEARANENKGNTTPTTK